MYPYGWNEDDVVDIYLDGHSEPAYSGHLDAGDEISGRSERYDWACLVDGSYSVVANLSTELEETFEFRDESNNLAFEFRESGHREFSLNGGYVHAHPTPSPTISSGPTKQPTPAPSDTPDFLLFYTSADKTLGEYNMRTGTYKDLLEGTDYFDGDVAVDSENQLLFFSSPSRGQITKVDLTSEEFIGVMSDTSAVPMGVAVDPYSETLYYVDQAYPSVRMISYAGLASVVEEVRNFTTEGITPVGLDVLPTATMDDFNPDNPGMIFVTGYSSLEGHIMQITLDGAAARVAYTTSNQLLYGVAVDIDSDLMWWVEDRGISNGLFAKSISSPDEDLVEVASIANAIWVAALWRLETIFTSDYDTGTIIEYSISREKAEVVSSQTVASPSTGECRGVAFYYGPAWSR